MRSVRVHSRRRVDTKVSDEPNVRICLSEQKRLESKPSSAFWQFSRKLLKSQHYLWVIKHAKQSSDASWFRELYKFTIDIDISSLPVSHRTKHVTRCVISAAAAWSSSQKSRRFSESGVCVWFLKTMLHWQSKIVAIHTRPLEPVCAKFCQFFLGREVGVAQLLRCGFVFDEGGGGFAEKEQYNICWNLANFKYFLT